APPALYTLSLHDALPICLDPFLARFLRLIGRRGRRRGLLRLFFLRLLRRLPRSRAPDDRGGGSACLFGPPLLLFPLHQLDDLGRSEEHTSELQSRFDLVC